MCIIKFFGKSLIIWLFVFASYSYSAVILQYHHISNETPKSTSTSPELFKQHINYLEENNFKVISLSNFVLHLEKKIPFDDKTVLITFDDGYSSIYEEALPILKKKKYPFAVFVNAEPIEQRLSGWMSWKELEELQDYKGEIANHSYSHKHLIRRENNESALEWKRRITDDLLVNQKLLERKLGIKNRVLAYPFGEYDLKNLKPLLAELNFYGLAQHSGAVSIRTEPQAIPRFAFGGSYGEMDDFKIKVNSLAIEVNKVELLDSKLKTLDDHVFVNDEYLPSLRITLNDELDPNQLQCFFSGQGKLEKQTKGTQVIFKLHKRLNPGRSRFNCTAPGKQKGRFYWFSQPIIRSLPDGQWYKE